MTSKRESAEAVRVGKALELFSHETFGHFNITRLREMINDPSQNPIKRHKSLFDEGRMVDGIPCDPWDYLWKNRDIDKEYAATLTAIQLIDPAIIVVCPAGSNGTSESHLIVDGVHRLYERKRRGKPEFYFYAVPLSIAPRIPDEVVRTLTSVSEILMPELSWGEYEFRDGGLYHRQTGERKISDIPGFFENGKRVNKENKS